MVEKDIEKIIHDIGNPFFSHYNGYQNRLLLTSHLNELFTKLVTDYNDNAREEPKEEHLKYVKEIIPFFEEDKKFFLSHMIKNSILKQLLSNSVGSLEISEIFIGLIREMSLVYLVSSFESFLESNFIYVFGMIPSMLKSKDKKISYEYIFSFTNFGDLSQELIDKEAKSIIDQDIDEVNQILNEKFKLVDLSIQNDWNDFKEIFYRRNLIVHRLSMIDKNYRVKTGFVGTETQISVDESYLKNSIMLFEKYGQIIHNSFVKKFK